MRIVIAGSARSAFRPIHMKSNMGEIKTSSSPPMARVTIFSIDLHSFGGEVRRNPAVLSSARFAPADVTSNSSPRHSQPHRCTHNPKRLPHNVVRQPRALSLDLAFMPAITSTAVGISMASDAKFDGACPLLCIGLSW